MPAASVPTGSAGIERTLAGYLNLAGIRPADTPLGLAGDYSPFLTAGVPIGGHHHRVRADARPRCRRDCGADTAGEAFDPSVRTPHDTIANVDRDALGITGPAVAFAVGTYAQSTEGVNGVPARRLAPPGIRPGDAGDEVVDAVLVGGQRARPRMRRATGRAAPTRRPPSPGGW